LRDLLWLMVVLAVCLAWYHQYSVYDANYRHLRASSAMMSRAVHETVSKEEFDAIQEKFHEWWRPYINNELGHKAANSN